MATLNYFDEAPDDVSATSDSTVDIQSTTHHTEKSVSNGQKSESSSSATSGTENFLEFVGNRTSDSEMITVEIDLTDPDDLARKLDMVDLTDEETDLLLERAQQLNVWLRQQLMRQTSSLRSDSVDERHRHSATCIVSAPAASALSDDDDGDKNTLGEPGVRRARTFSGNSCLPPLVRQQGHSATSAPSMSYTRAERSPLAPYYSQRGPASTYNSRRLPPTLHSVSKCIIKNLFDS